MNILVLRFSARGDVALCVPVLREATSIHEDLKITFVSRAEFQPFFNAIPNFQFVTIDMPIYGNFRGLWRFSRLLKKKDHFDVVIDLHGVLRARLLTFFLNIKTFHIQKGRMEKWRLTRRKNKILQPLKHTTERYRDVFKAAGIRLMADDLQYKIIPVNTGIPRPTRAYKIGISPTSRHELKNWPMEHMKRLIELIRENTSAEVYILGGASEKEKLESLFGQNATVVAGKHSNSEEFIQYLNLVVCMDSANMHVATLLGVPVISIWGPTHPFLGFAPLGKKNKIIQIDYLNCRPCSVHGNRPCFRKDHACMVEIQPEHVFREIRKFMEE